MHGTRKLGAVAVAAASWLATPAFGQVEEIVVTATRREESIQTVPVSITALSADQLSAAGVEGVRDLGTLTPGLNMNARSNVWIPFIRGIGSGDTSGGQESGVSIYIDGVYMSSPHAGSMTFNSIDHVEVLKGPQGTLFGRNSTGGLIHIITRDPSDKTEVFGKVSYGNYETSAAQLYMGGGIAENLAADIALNYADQNKGYGENVVTGKDFVGDEDRGVRTKWIWDAGASTKVTLTADWQKHESGQGDNRALLPGSVAFDGTTALSDFYDVQLNFPTYGRVENYGTMVKLQHEFDFANFVSISAYRKLKDFNSFDNDGLPSSVVEARQKLRVETFTQELQLLSRGEGKLDWIVGAFFMHDNNGYIEPGGLELQGVQVLPIPGATVEFIHSMRTDSIAAFAEGTYHFTDATRLTLGARITKDEKELSGKSVYNTVIPGIIFPGAPPTVVVDGPVDNPPSKSWTEPTFRVAVEHDVTDNMMAYASYNRGFRSGSYNTVGVTGIPIDPEISNAYEVGLKSQLFDDRVRLNAAAYYTDYKDLQVVISRGPTTDLLNAGEAEIKGLELDAEAAVTDSLTLRAAVSYIDSEYKKFVAGYLCSERNAQGQTQLQAPCSPEGNDLLRTPEWTLNLGAAYEVPVSFGKVGANLDYFWTDDFNWELDGRLVEPSYGLLNGRLYWSSEDDRYGVALFGRNLTDKKYSTFDVAQSGSRQDPPNAAPVINIGIGDQYTPAAPRTYGVEFNFNF